MTREANDQESSNTDPPGSLSVCVCSAIAVHQLNSRLLTAVSRLAAQDEGGEGEGEWDCTLRGALLGEQLLRAGLAVRLALLLDVRGARQGVHAEGAGEVLRVPLLVERRDAPALNGLLAALAQRARLLVVVLLAVRLAADLEERLRAERLLAERASPVLLVPLLAERVHAVAADGLVAGGALWAVYLEKVRLAVGLAVALVEHAARERLQALGADEVVDVPLLAYTE